MNLKHSAHLTKIFLHLPISPTNWSVVIKNQPPIASPQHQQKGLHARNSLSPSAPALTSLTKAHPQSCLAFLSAVHDQAVIEALVVEPSPLTLVVQPTTPLE